MDDVTIDVDDLFGYSQRPDDDTCRSCGGVVEPPELPSGKYMPPPAKCGDCRDDGAERTTDEDIFRRSLERAVPSERHRSDIYDVAPELVGPVRRCVDLSDDQTLGPSCYIWGPVGTGKTTQAAKACAVYLWQRIVGEGDPRASARMVSEPELFSRLRGSMDDDTENVESIMAEYREVDLLVLDDFGVSRASSWVAENLYLLVDQRYEAGRPVIWTSNFPLSELQNRGQDQSAEVYDDRIISRIGHMVDAPDGRCVELTEDYRGV